MNKKIITATAVAVILVIVGTSMIFHYASTSEAPVESGKSLSVSGSSDETLIAANGGIEKTKADYELAVQADYVATAPEDLLDIADLVVYGKYLGDEETHASERGTPVTSGKFSVETVIKGTTENHEIEVEFYGGKISVEEYIQTQDESSIKKDGFDKLSFSARNAKTVGIAMTGESVTAEADKEYICFLSKNPETGKYFVLCDTYGMRATNGQKEFYNPETEAFESISLYQ